jgi:xylulokinase
MQRRPAVPAAAVDRVAALEQRGDAPRITQSRRLAQIGGAEGGEACRELRPSEVDRIQDQTLSVGAGAQRRRGVRLEEISGLLWVISAQQFEQFAGRMTDTQRQTMDQFMAQLRAGEGPAAAGAASGLGGMTVDVVNLLGGDDGEAGQLISFYAAGIGVIAPGDAFLSLGTSGVLFLVTPKFLPNPAKAVHAFCHCLPNLWHQMSVMLSAASCVDWAVKLTGTKDAAELLSKVEARGSLDGPEIFLPYLSGERTPHNDPQARGVLFGLNHDSDAAAIGQAVLEGVAFAFADGLDGLIEAGATIDKISVIGGGARSMWWGGVLAAALKRPLIYRDGSEVGPAFGAARLARIAKTGERAEDVCRPPPVRVVIEPNARDIEQLAPKRQCFSKIYQDLRPRFRGV